MPVHSMHIFDRKGKTLYTRRFVKSEGEVLDAEQLSEQRKLVFGMIFSLREIVASLSPTTPSQSSTSGGGKGGGGAPPVSDPSDEGLHSVQTGASTLYSYETPSGLRIVLFITPTPLTKGDGRGSGSSGGSQLQQQQQQSAAAAAALLKQQQRAKSIRMALKHIYHELWMQCVIRSPLYTPTEPNVQDTNFGQRLEAFLKAQNWY